MTRTSSYVVFAALALAVPELAHASYRDGALGVVLFYLSVPVAALGCVLTNVLVALGKFGKARLLAAYCVIWCVAYSVTLALSTLPSDPASTGIVGIGDGVLLVLVLLPALLHWQRLRAAREISAPPAHPASAAIDTVPAND